MLQNIPNYKFKNVFQLGLIYCSEVLFIVIVYIRMTHIFYFVLGASMSKYMKKIEEIRQSELV